MIGAVSQIDRTARPDFYRVWCAAYELNLVVQVVINDVLNEQFGGPMNQLIAHLLQQLYLRREMETTCSTLATTRWLSTGNATNWLVRHFRVI